MKKENTYWALNSARTKDEELDHVIDRTVSGLFSVMATMGMMPSRIYVNFANLRSRHAYNTMSQGGCGGDDSS
jgi:hypothetical protein